MARGKARPDQAIAIGHNPERQRSHNRRVVLEAVRLHGPAGRAAIARLTRLTAPAVSNIVSELVAEGFLVEPGSRRTGRGPPPLENLLHTHGGLTAGAAI